MSNIAVKWAGEGSLMFIGRDSYGHVVTAGSWASDDPEWQEWKATKPSDLLLISLASCSAYDMVLILGRQRQKLVNLCVRVDGQQMPRPPHAFIAIQLHYILEGENLDPKKVERAINLSRDRYCSVAATVRGVAELTCTYEIHERCA
jgi:putative redox protein